MTTLNFLGIPGSLRQASFNLQLLQAAQTVLPEDVTLNIYKLNDLPIFNPDLEGDGTIPEPVEQFHQAIRQADAIVFATPEYNFSIPGALKSALDWASRRGTGEMSPLRSKPVAIMGAAGWVGSTRAQLHLREILVHDNMYVLNTAVQVPNARLHFENGKLMDERTLIRVQTLMLELKTWTLQLQK